MVSALCGSGGLPRTAFTYLNLGPIRQTGLELRLDQQFSRSLAAFVNYSWQSEPKILDTTGSAICTFPKARGGDGEFVRVFGHDAGVPWAFRMRGV